MIYIHIPFCTSKCAYCDFFSRRLQSIAEAEQYVRTLIKEWQLRRDEVPGPVSTIYIGGGTPSILPHDMFDILFAGLPLDEAIEITLEANPEQITPDFIRWVECSPINRISIGIQSLNDTELEFVGRHHNAATAINAINQITNSSLDNFSLDLIFGLPGQDFNSWKYTLDSVLSFRPSHLSCYILTYEPKTRLDALRLSGKITPASDELIAEMYFYLCDATLSAGYEHYEISNFALPGRRAVHNTNYWLNKPYVGLGAGAWSFDGKIRRFNPTDIRKYLTLSDTPVYESESESPVELHNNLLLTSLRLKEGLDLNLYSKLYGQSAKQRLLNLASRYINNGYMIIDNTNCIKFSEKGWLISDNVLVDLFED